MSTEKNKKTIFKVGNVAIIMVLALVIIRLLMLGLFL